VYGFYEGEGEVRPEGDNNLPSKVSAEEHKESSTSSSGIEIGSTNDPRLKAAELNNRGACSGGWSNFFGVFAACTGANREAANIPKPGETNGKEEEEKTK
jgi:hypothetical protein